MTDEDLKVAGVAWNLATQALKERKLEEAERLCSFMVKSDAKLMRKRIEAADPNFYAKETKFR